MIKVLMITNRFIFGGIEKFLLDVFKNSDNTNINYDVLTLTSEHDEILLKKMELLGVKYYSLNLDQYSIFRRQFRHYKTLYDFLKKNKYNIVHVNITSHARALDMLVFKLAGVEKRIIHVHSANVITSNSRKILKPIKILFKKLFDFTATDFLACSDSAASYFFSKTVNKNHTFKVINNGINIEKYKFSYDIRESMRKKLRICQNKFVVGHVGRLTKAKNHSFLIDIFGEIHKKRPESVLLIVGDGELKEDIANKIKLLGLDDCIFMLGSSLDISSLLSAMDVFLFPSIWEGFGIALLEAQSNGLPCYVSENIPQDSCINSNVYRINLHSKPMEWSNRILSSNNERVEESYKIRNAGFDIKYSVNQLENIYYSED